MRTLAEAYEQARSIEKTATETGKIVYSFYSNDDQCGIINPFSEGVNPADRYNTSFFMSQWCSDSLLLSRIFNFSSKNPKEHFITVEVVYQRRHRFIVVFQDYISVHDKCIASYKDFYEDIAKFGSGSRRKIRKYFSDDPVLGEFCFLMQQAVKSGQVEVDFDTHALDIEKLEKEIDLLIGTAVLDGSTRVAIDVLQERAIYTFTDIDLVLLNACLFRSDRLADYYINQSSCTLII